jgi:amino acid adenylation domain-containing protein
VHNGISTTYRTLAERVRSVSQSYARELGVANESKRIAVSVSHTPAMAEHLLGIMQAGATYCPIDAALPDGRRQALIETLGVHRLFTTGRERCESAQLTVQTLNENPTAPEGLPLEPVWDQQDPAYVLCTSGSTGAPKPVAVSRRALAVTVRELRHLFALTPEDRVLQFASLGWDTCLEEILPALTAGATLVFDDAAHSGSFPSFIRMLTEQSVTVLDLPTAFWHELVLFLHDEQAVLPDIVRLVIIGGERVDPTRLQQWRDLNIGHVRLLNTYGCTETTLVTHAVQLSGPGTDLELAPYENDIPIGRPLPHVRDHVTDEGELLVSGPGLATGYLASAELTDSAFPVVDHGSGPTRWFCTGDLVTRGQRGLLYSRGRSDEQVKVLGVRVHPAEVEAHLTSHPAVGGAVVVGERLLGRTSLTAYVVQTGPSTPAELKRYLSEHLPSQFVPTKVTYVAALSYTVSGKIDRAATAQAATHRDSRGDSR